MNLESNIQEILDYIKNEHPETVFLRARVDELLVSNTELVFENRELKGQLELRDMEDSSAGEAVEVLFKALKWNSGGLGSAAIEIVKQRDEAIEMLEKKEKFLVKVLFDSFGTR